MKPRPKVPNNAVPDFELVHAVMRRYVENDLLAGVRVPDAPPLPIHPFSILH
jgi:hypothetical protein